MPDTAAERKKWFLKKGGGAESLVWEEGRVFHCDFFNPYLDFNSKFLLSCPLDRSTHQMWLTSRETDFALKLPGFSLSLLSYLGGEDYLRFARSPSPDMEQSS